MTQPVTLTEDDLDDLGTLVDCLDNAYHASLLPLPDQLHVEGLVGSVKSVRDELRAILARLGYNPWGDE